MPVADILLIPEIFVELSPIIFPLALILPTKVDTPLTFKSSSSVCPLTSNCPIGAVLLIPIAF